MGPIVSPTANRAVSRGWICWRRADAHEHTVGILDLLTLLANWGLCGIEFPLIIIYHSVLAWTGVPARRGQHIGGE